MTDGDGADGLGADAEGHHPAVLGVRQTPPGLRVPSDACDCHTHVFGPAERYPFDPARTYTPGDAALADLKALHAVLGLDRVVIVHPSPYGTDNRCTLDAIRSLGDTARGVAVIDDVVDEAALRAMHEAGVRGVRVNLETYGQTDPESALARIRAASRKVAPLGWHVQVYTRLDLLTAIADDIAGLPTLLVIDHFGRSSAAAGPSQAGFDRLLRLLDGGKVYLKLSASYRVTERADHADVRPLARALIAANPERVVWGTDWPHPGAAAGRARRPKVIEPFRPIDDGAALNRLADWAGDEATLARILVENPARLYDFPTSDNPRRPS